MGSSSSVFVWSSGSPARPPTCRLMGILGWLSVSAPQGLKPKCWRTEHLTQGHQAEKSKDKHSYQGHLYSSGPQTERPSRMGLQVLLLGWGKSLMTAPGELPCTISQNGGRRLYGT